MAPSDGLQVTAPGTLNAIVFWFDLHLDAEETLTNGEGVAAMRALQQCAPQH